MKYWLMILTITFVLFSCSANKEYSRVKSGKAKSCYANNDFAEGYILAQQIVAENPKVMVGYYYSAYNLKGLGRLEEAYENFDKIKTRSLKVKTTILLEKLKILYYWNEHEKIKKEVIKGFKYHQKKGQSALDLFYLFFFNNDIESADYTVNRLLELENRKISDKVKDLTRKNLLLYNQKRYDECLQSLDTQIEIDEKRNLKTLMLKMLLLLEISKPEAAKEMIEEYNITSAEVTTMKYRFILDLCLNDGDYQLVEDFVAAN